MLQRESPISTETDTILYTGSILFFAEAFFPGRKNRTVKNNNIIKHAANKNFSYPQRKY